MAFDKLPRCLVAEYHLSPERAIALRDSAQAAFLEWYRPWTAVRDTVFMACMMSRDWQRRDCAAEADTAANHRVPR